MKDFESEYRRLGAYHFASSGFRKWWQARNYRMLAGVVRPGMRVLDLACGDGRLFAERGLQQSRILVGIDKSMAALSACALRFPSTALAQADLLHLPLAAATFDLVIISLALQYIVREKLGAVLTAVRRVLKPQGRLVLTYPNAGKYESYKPVKDDDALPPAELAEEVGRAGFEVKKRESICRVAPAWVCRLSVRPPWSVLAWLYFRGTNLLPPREEESYHFMWIVKKSGSLS